MTCHAEVVEEGAVQVGPYLLHACRGLQHTLHQTRHDGQQGSRVQGGEEGICSGVWQGHVTLGGGVRGGMAPSGSEGEGLERTACLRCERRIRITPCTGEARGEESHWPT